MMAYDVSYWVKLYKKLKYESLCVDIEVTRIGGPISVVGLYRPKEGLMECETFVRGINLTAENLKRAFEGCKMTITFYGLKQDIPKINQEFSGVIPANIPHFDLYFFAEALKYGTGLKVLENTFGIDRGSIRSRMTRRYWDRYTKYHDETALNHLIEYNKQDTINLYPLAEQLVKIAEENI